MREWCGSGTRAEGSEVERKRGGASLGTPGGRKVDKERKYKCGEMVRAKGTCLGAGPRGRRILGLSWVMLRFRV